GAVTFTCTNSAVNGSSTVSTISSTGTSKGYICPSWDAASHTFYNGCWDSVATGNTAQLCTGSSCSCTGAASGCSCSGSGSGSGKVCTTPTFTHTWHA